MAERAAAQQRGRSGLQDEQQLVRGRAGGPGRVRTGGEWGEGCKRPRAAQGRPMATITRRARRDAEAQQARAPRQEYGGTQHSRFGTAP